MAYVGNESENVDCPIRCAQSIACRSASGFLDTEHSISYIQGIKGNGSTIPITVIQNDDIGSRQVDIKSTSARRQQEDELLATRVRCNRQ